MNINKDLHETALKNLLREKENDLHAFINRGLDGNGSSPSTAKEFGRQLIIKQDFVDKIEKELDTHYPKTELGADDIPF